MTTPTQSTLLEASVALPEPLTREQWTRRFADRVKQRAGWNEEEAMECATVSAEVNFQNNGDEWLDPEDDADVEMSYFDNDGED